LAGVILTAFTATLYAKENKNPQDAQLEKARAEFVKKLGSKTARFQVREIKEGFVFDEAQNHMTLLVLWDKNCKSCIKQIPNLNRYLLDMRGKLEIIGVELSGMSSKELQKFAKEKKVLYTLISGIENKEFVSAAMRKFGFGKDKDGKSKKEGLPFMVAMGYTGHTHAIIRGIPNDPAQMEEFLMKIIDHYEKKKNTEANASKTNK